MKDFAPQASFGLGAACVLAVAYILFSGPMAPASGSGSVICYTTGRFLTPEDCVVYTGPNIKIPDDI